MSDMSKRIRYTVIFSSPTLDYQTVLAFLAPKLGEQFAGACFDQVDGSWSEEGHLHQQSYAKVHVEPGMRILVSVMPQEKTQAYETLQNLIGETNQALSLGLSWVHVESEEVDALHFQTSAP